MERSLAHGKAVGPESTSGESLHSSMWLATLLQAEKPLCSAPSQPPLTWPRGRSQGLTCIALNFDPGYTQQEAPQVPPIHYGSTLETLPGNHFSLIDCFPSFALVEILGTRISQTTQ